MFDCRASLGHSIRDRCGVRTRLIVFFLAARRPLSFSLSGGWEADLNRLGEDSRRLFRHSQRSQLIRAWDSRQLLNLGIVNGIPLPHP